MKLKSMAVVLAMTLTIGSGVTAYAAPNNASSNNSIISTTCERLGLNRLTGVRGYDSVFSILKDKLNLTEDDINDALNSGKTMYEIAEDKGLSSEELKSAILAERIEAIQNAVKNGSITEVQGNALIESLKNNIENCTGTPSGSCGMRFNQSGGRGRGQGRGFGRGQGNGFNCTFTGTSSSSQQ